MNELCAEGAWERIMQATGATTQMELAAKLGIRQSSVSDAKRRGVVPAGWLLQLARLGHNPLWIESGRGKEYLTTASVPPGVFARRASLRDVSTEELMGELSKRCGVTVATKRGEA